MKRSAAIFLSGIAAATLAYCGIFYAGTARHCGMEKSANPELTWLKEEFHLTDAEFARISQMHEQYFAGCAERCRRIDLKNQELAQLLAATNNVTPAIAQALSESAQLRANCQKEMLQHFYDVSRTMPPEQGRRYLTWVQQQTVLPDTHATMHH
jgi:hypothetical protein